MSVPRVRGPLRVSAWLRRWGPLLPLLVAELIVMIGFGALLPVLPLYVQEQGISATQLGLIVAAWPIAKLISEPIAGWWADRHWRKPQMVAGLVILGIASLLPLFFTSFAALFGLRFIAGAATGLFDPAARGMIVDATDEDERGEAFGFYAAFQIGGFAIGPAIGALGAALIGGYAFPFFFTCLLAMAAGVVLAIYLSPRPHVVEAPEFDHHPEVKPLPPGVPFSASELAAVPRGPSSRAEQAPISAIFNRTVVAALVLTFGLHLSFGTYEVVWSLYLIALGATITWVGATFVLFAIPEMLASPIAGRYIDRKGPIGFVIGSGLVIIVSGALYALASEPVLPTLVVPVEAAATAVMNPALFAMLARGTPAGRSSTAQGLFGAASTLALVVASVVAGSLFEQDIGLPFWFFVVGMIGCLIAGLLIYRSARSAVSPVPARAPAAR
ncbi:MAG TPA: MFS transporter [Candidatus Limnocylindrales bacterium]|nr:MFS transporter [Candidatus Limnocylindrales bacterium]